MPPDSLAARKARWCALYADAPAPRHIFTIHAPGALPEPPRPWPWPDNKAARIESAWASYCNQRERAEWLPDDAIPYLDVYTGTEIFAEAFGCAVVRPDDTMPFARPLISSAAEVDAVQVPDLSARPLADLFDIADELRRRAGDEAVMKLIDTQSPMDIAALIWDKNDFFIAMLDAPDAVHALAHKVGQLFTAFLDEWFARYGRDFIAHYPAYYMPHGLTLSEDEVGIVNPELFAEFFLPELVQLSARYGGLGMHCCAHSRHQWEGFLQIPGLRVLNLVQPPEVISAAYRFFAPHLVQIHSNYPDGDPWTWPAQLPADARIIFQLSAQTREDALALAEKMRAVCGG
jgi:hypothetical protein